MKSSVRLLYLSLVSGVTLSACTLAPHYETPTVRAPVIAGIQGKSVTAAHLSWQNYFADPRLKLLIESALKNNTDLRLATLNAEAARAQYGITRAALLPSIGVDGSMMRGRNSAFTSPTGQSMVAEQYQVGLGIAAWELDLFGKVRSLGRVGLFNYFSAQYSRDAAQISLISAVAKSYFAQKTAQAMMDYAHDTLKSREESHRLVELSARAGVVSSIDLSQSLTQIESARAAFYSAKTARDAAQNALTVLTGGVVPENMPEGLPLTQQFSGAIPAGVASDLLNYRPDIQAAEAGLKVANAQIGAARAAFFPSIRLTSSIGSSSLELDDLFTGPAATWSFVPQITLPIFTWGANKANLDLAHVRKNMAVAQYEKTVQNAFRDAANALSAHESLQKQIEAQNKIAKASQEVMRLTEMRYRQGIASSLERLDARRQSYAAETARLQVLQKTLDNYVDLYAVFGGGLDRVSSND